MVNALSAGIGGVAAGMARLDRAAVRIAGDSGSADLAGHLTELLHARHQVRASLAVVKAADETVGTLLDVFA